MLNIGMTLPEAFREVAGSRMGQEALVCGETRATYRQLLERTGALAQSLYRLGVRKGDKVAALLPPGTEFACLFFAVAEMGAVIAPLDPQLRRHSLTRVLQSADPVALFTSHPIEKEVLEQAASLRHVVPAYAGAEPGGTLSDLMSADEPISLPPSGVVPQDMVALLYTSGTTGTPKGTMHSHRSLIAPVVATFQVRELWKRPSLKTLGPTFKALVRYREKLLRAATGSQTFLTSTGWHTITGLEILLQTLLMGDKLVMPARFSPREMLRLVERERVTIMVNVPTVFQVLLGVPDLEQYDTSSLLICGVGAAPCPPHLAQEIQRRFHCAIHIGFGATELGGGISVTSLADADRQRTETVGRPLPGMEAKIVDEQHRELATGQVGELACRGNSVMMGYYQAPEATAQVIDEEGWYYTGDLARMDEGGYIHIVGRKKDMIIRGGQNVYPAEVESYLTSHPKIREAAVVGVPSALEGESVWAFLLLESGIEMTDREVLDYCRLELELYKIPSRVRFMDEFPRSATGKPQKFKLRERALDDLKGGEQP